jgi:hypothetical protein
MPAAFDLMLSNPKRYTDDAITLNTDETIRWIWFAYYYGAKKSLELSVPCSQAG